jgi:ATP-dependent RNA helicase DHX29
VTCDEDFEPDKLLPEYLATKRRLLEIERKHTPPRSTAQTGKVEDLDPDMVAAKLEARLRRIEADVLFDKFVADQQWRAQKVNLEKELSAAKREVATGHTNIPEDPAKDDAAQGINDEASRIAAEILAENNDEDDDISGLFASLPQNEVDPVTGQMQTVINSSDGAKSILKDFGKWTGVSPRRVLEEACRSRSVIKRTRPCFSELIIV